MRGIPVNISGRVVQAFEFGPNATWLAVLAILVAGVVLVAVAVIRR